jgi:poly-beta-1,6-N-acetyl-D-glucosamine synthase
MVNFGLKQMDAILYLFFSVLIIANFKLFIQLSLSISYNLKKSNKTFDRFPKISIVVPAYNEEKTITKCIESLLNLEYPNYETIIVDDGSTDKTYQEAIKIKNANLTVIHQENTGKPRALNKGIKHSTGEIILTVDADTTLDKQALKKNS